MSDQSCILAAMKRARAPLTRDEFLTWFYIGEAPDVIPSEGEAEFTEQFQLVALLDSPVATDKVL